MPTIIDSLIVKLGLDSKDLDTKSGAAGKKLKDLEGASKDTEGSVKKLSSASKTTSTAVDGLAKSVGSFLAILGGTMALRAFIEDTIASNAALDRLSKNLGMNVEDVSAWGNAVEQMGGSAKGLQGTLSMLSQSQTELRLTGQSNLIPYFSALGVSMAGVGGVARPVNDILLDLAGSFSKMDRTTANNMGKMMGIDQDTLNLLLQGRQAVELMIKRQKETNAVTKEQAEQSAKLQKQMIGLKQNFEAVGRSLLQSASPAIEKFLQILTSLSQWVQNNAEFIKDFGMILGVVAAGLGAVSLAASPITLTVAAVLALAAGIALLWQDYQTWKRGGDSLIDWEKWKPGIDATIAGLQDLRETLKDIATAISIVNKGLSGDTKGANTASEKFHDKLTKQLGINSDWSIQKSVGNLYHSLKTKKGAKEVGKKIWDATSDDSLISKGKTVGRGISKATSDDTLTLGMSTAFGLANGKSVTSEYAMKYFMSRGMSQAEAAGLASQIHSESNGKTDAVGDHGAAYGLIQWHKDRQEAFKKFTGRDIQGSSADDQLSFMVHELNSGDERGAGKKLKGATSAEQAGQLASKFYVRPKDVEGEASRRGSYAAMIAGMPGASSTVAAAGNTSGGGSSSTSNDHSTNINGPVTIMTRATDGAGILSDLKSKVSYGFTAQANSGLN